MLVLKARAWFGKERDFFFRGLAPKYGIAVRVASETINDRFVAQFKIVVALFSLLPEQALCNFVNQL